MIIESVNIPKDFADDGLCDIKMTKLGSVVVIAGKNGSGKTRLLKRILTCVNNRPDRKEIANNEYWLESHQNRLKSETLSPDDTVVCKKRINECEQELALVGYLQFSEDLFKYKAIEFVPQGGNFKDSEAMSSGELLQAHNSCQNSQIDQLIGKTLPYIQVKQNRWYEVTHQNSTAQPDKKEEYENFYAHLKDLIKTFIGSDIDRDVDGCCTIFGLKLGQSNLSAGQKILLQLCVAIHAQGADLDGLILILDEPENHLHPSALIDFFNTVNDVLKNGQIWIATHSINLLSQVDTSSIFYMEDNAIEYSGSSPERVLNGLLGDEEQKIKLRDFIDLPDVLASINFAYQCLFKPEAAFPQTADKQTSQMVNKIQALREGGKKIRVLDYGAGKGRLAEAIYFEEADSEKEKIKDWLDYIAFDEYPDDKEWCRKAISKIYGDCNKRYYSAIREVCADKDRGTVDIIVMCNVLHEIESDKWVSIFKKDSDINQLLKEDGYLLIVEDLEMPKGEKPHENGFLVLGKREIKELFLIKEGENGYFCDSFEGNERLMAYMIPKKCVSRINDDSYTKALGLVFKII